MIDKQKRSLAQIAMDMRAAGELLLEGAAELEEANRLLSTVNLSALSTLLGGGPLAALPFRQPQPQPPASPPLPTPPTSNGSTPDAPNPIPAVKLEAVAPSKILKPRKLSRAQKDEIRGRWQRLPEPARTDAMADRLAAEYKTTRKHLKLICSAMDNREASIKRLEAAREAKRRNRQSGSVPATPTQLTHMNAS